MKKVPEIVTPNGKGLLENIWISELGILMIRVEFEDGNFISYNIGKFDSRNNILSDAIFKSFKSLDETF